MIKNKLKRISIIGSLAVLLTGGLGFGIVRMIAPLPVFGDNIPATTQAAVQAETATQTETQDVAGDTEVNNENLNNQSADTDNIQDENLNEQDDAQEAKGAVEANESSSDNEQGENLPGGGHEDIGNEDHQFEGTE
jgi:hypothetical protein